MTNLFTNYSAKAQILATKKLIENSTQKPNSAWYFRPPWGAINKDIEKVLEDENIKPVLADIFMAKAQAFKDFKSIEPVDKTSKKILNNTQNGTKSGFCSKDIIFFKEFIFYMPSKNIIFTENNYIG